MQAFPSVDSLLRLVGAVCRDQNDAWASAKSLIDRRSLAQDCRPAPRGDRSSEAPAFARVVREAFDKRRQAA